MNKALRYLLIIGFFSLLLLISCDQVNKNITSDKPVSEVKSGHKLKTNRVLVIIDEQWRDPQSYNIDNHRVEGGEFIDIITMLKIWGIPFDILRLDEQRLQINRFLDGAARAKYGCAVWLADPDKLKGNSAKYSVLKKAVDQYGMSLIILFDNIKTKEIADLAGIQYLGTSSVSLEGIKNKFSFKENHFITKNVNGISLPDTARIAIKSIPEANGITLDIKETGTSNDSINIVHCAASASVDVIGKIDGNPQLVVRNISDSVKVIWIGGGKDWYRKYPAMREIFRNSLVYSIGYGVFNDNFDNGFIFIMDDIGCSEHAYSLRWHYPTPSKETLIKYLIEPLEKEGLVMVQNITPGYANPKTKTIEVPWDIVPFVDTFGNYQNYGSTKEGLEEGLKRGVFEIQGHRAWSHMNWDLDSSPGPWWGSPIDGEMNVTEWYNEVVDVRRGSKPVPSNDLLFIYKSGIDAIKKAFGVVALSAEVRPGAELMEGTHGGDDNGRVAAISGIGVSRECYVGHDLTIEFSMMMPDQFTCHDLDLTERTDNPADTDEAGWDKLSSMSTAELVSSKIVGGRRINLTNNTNWIEKYKHKDWMGFNECCAYLHSSISNEEEYGLQIGFYFDDHYCKYFEKNPSSWTLELSDDFLNSYGKDMKISIDGKGMDISAGPKQKIEIPAGLGYHKIDLNII